MSKVTSEHQLSVKFQLPSVWPAQSPPFSDATTLHSSAISEQWTLVVNERYAEEIAGTLEGVAATLREFAKKKRTP